MDTGPLDAAASVRPAGATAPAPEETSDSVDTEEYDRTESPSNPKLRTLSGEKINPVIGKQIFVVELYDNSAANDLLSRLPLTYTISDYGWGLG